MSIAAKQRGKELATTHLDTCYEEIEQLRIWYGHGEKVARGELPHSASYLNKLLQGEELRSTVMLPRPSLVAIHKAITDLRGLRQPSVRALNYINDLFALSGAERPDTVAIVGHLGRGVVQTCVQTVPTFYETLRQVETGKSHNQSQISVYYREVDGMAEPILLRKTTQVPTALTLQPIELDGVQLPAGTVVNLSEDTIEYELTGEKKMNDGRADFRYAAYRMPSQIELGYGGLSPWAFQDHELRAGYAVTDIYMGETDMDRLHMVMGINLSDFQSAARQVLSTCGVPNVVK